MYLESCGEGRDAYRDESERLAKGHTGELSWGTQGGGVGHWVSFNPFRSWVKDMLHHLG